MSDALFDMTPEGENKRRCPSCDSVVPAGEQICIMCGTAMPTEAVAVPVEVVTPVVAGETAVPPPLPTHQEEPTLIKQFGRER